MQNVVMQDAWRIAARVNSLITGSQVQFSFGLGPQNTASR